MITGEMISGIGCVLLGIAVLLLVRQLSEANSRLDFYEDLIRHARTETRLALAVAQKTERLIISAVNGAVAQRTLSPEKDANPLQLLEQRVRYRTIETVNLGVSEVGPSPTTREGLDPSH